MPPDNIIQTLLVNGGLGSTAALVVWLYMQERKDRKAIQDENKQLRDQYAEHLQLDISDKINDREALKQALSFIKGVKE